MNTLHSYEWSRPARLASAWRAWPPRWSGRLRPDRSRPASAALIYWRRRLVALTVGLAGLGLITWALSSALSGAATANGTGSASTGQPGQGGAAGGQQPGAGASTSAAPRTSGPTASEKPGPCPHGTVVLSLSVSAGSYGPSELPHFSVDVVTTNPATCTFNLGASHVALVVQSGSDPIWSSADCVRGPGGLVSDLQRGVPTTMPISWNRESSEPGCPATSGEMPSGTYTATVKDGWLRSNTVTFRLR